MQYKIFFFIFIAFISNSCTVSKYAAGNKLYKTQVKAFADEIKKQPATIDSTQAAVDWAGTVNFNLRKPNFVILHHTAQNSCVQTINTFTLSRTEVSAHYVICKDGTVQHMLSDYLRAWHAGAGRWGNVTDINSVSIGIELDNNGVEPFTEAQINNLLIVLRALKKSYNIPTANFIGHADIAPSRKVDPSRLFPWQQLAQQGFGYWYGDLSTKYPENFDAMQALRIIGYDTQDSIAAIKAFKLHFVQNDSVSVLTDGDKRIIYDLYKKY
ncbi:MAG: N-acetylmuramoyl-L-alanine amidase [Chitinophagaceae bacterium]|nr:N-acetylmuramoyl-L-alanine amidase [Chitinophagaceae bacterium]